MQTRQAKSQLNLTSVQQRSILGEKQGLLLRTVFVFNMAIIALEHQS